MPKRASLPSMLPPGCSRAGGLVDAERGEQRVAGLLGRIAHEHSSGTKITVIAASTAQPWRVSPTIRPNV